MPFTMKSPATGRAKRQCCECDGGAPPMENGDRLTQAEFHRRYEQMPADVRAELIGGIVYMPSPLRLPHGKMTPRLASVLLAYEVATPGVEMFENATTILGKNSEPQPDLGMRLLPERGGRSRVNENQYLVGPPELLIEVAHSSVAIDLHRKKEDYRAGGVREYLVACLEERELLAFDLPEDEPRVESKDRIWRSRVFPGLWIDGAALFDGDLARLLRTGQRGLKSADHKAFAEAVKQRRAVGKSRGKK